MTVRLSPLLALGLLVAPIFLAPSDAGACSWSPLVADSRIEGTLPVCLFAKRSTTEAAGQERDPNDRLTNLSLANRCDTPVAFDVPDCIDCEEPILLDPEDSVVIDVGIHIDETVGENIDVPVEWSMAEDAGEFTVVFEMADTHPDEQAGPDCGVLGCSVGGQGGTPAFAALLILVGAWSRRPRAWRLQPNSASTLV